MKMYTNSDDLNNIPSSNLHYTEEKMEEKAVKIGSINNFELFHIKHGKFKTNCIEIFFVDNINAKTVTPNALFPAVLGRGCEKYPTQKELALRLQELYGAGFNYGVTKKGEYQIIFFHIDFVSDKYTEIEEGTIFKACVDFIYNAIFVPSIENGAFNKDYVLQEKNNLRNRIESRVNDKMQYAVDRCFEEMTQEEPFSLYEFGRTKDLEQIDEQSLYQHYKNAVASLPAYIYLSGDFGFSQIEEVKDKFSHVKRDSVIEIKDLVIKSQRTEPIDITEKMNINQAKLSLGFKTNIGPKSESYYALMLYNSILGGGIHSKLFQNVREKASLAYYAFSRLEKYKGLMIISSGIDINNKEKAFKIIMEQIEDIKAGKIMEHELQAALKSYDTGLNSLKDSQISVVDYFFGQRLIGSEQSFEEMLDKLKSVSIKDIIEVAQGIGLDTIYFLTSEQQI